MERCASCQNFIFKEEIYWQLLMGVKGNVKSGWTKFSLQHSIATFPVKGGVTKKEEVQHTKKTRIPKNSGKDRTLKEEEERP